MAPAAWEIEAERNVKLFIGVPITPSFQYNHSVFQEAFEQCWKPNPTVRIFERSHGIATAREALTEKFLSGDWTHLMFLDGDIVLRPDTIKKMLEANKPVVVGRYHETSDRRLPEVFKHSQVPFKRDAPIDFKENEVLEFPDDAEDVLLCGLGLIMIKREVFEQLEKPYFLFSSEYNDLSDYWRVSEDFYVMLKIQNKGVRVTYIPGISAGHIGQCIVFDQTNIHFL